MNLPRLVTSVVVVFVVVFLVWWFMIHKSITNKEGESRTAELVQKQRDVKEIKDRSQNETAVATANDEAAVDGQADQETLPVDKPADKPDDRPADETVEKPAVDKTEDTGAGKEETATEKVLPVSKPGTVTPAPEGSYYSVHVASFKEMSRAGTETDYLDKKGYETIVLEAVVKGQTWYRVYVGEFGTKEEAAATRLQLLDLSRIGYAKVVTLKNSNN